MIDIPRILAGVQVRYSVSLEGAAGLPRWLTLLQAEEQNATSPVFLYGTPEIEHLGQITLIVSLGGFTVGSIAPINCPLCCA